jgi:glycosyltransferase involved in cell wall biosynthesis
MRLLYHLPTTLSPVINGTKQRAVGTLDYLKRRSDITVDAVASNPYGLSDWDEEQVEFIKRYCDNVYVYDGSKSKLDYAYSRSQSIFYQKLLKSQLPIDTDYHTPIGYKNFVAGLLEHNDYDAIWVNYLDFGHLAQVKGAGSIRKIMDTYDLACGIRMARREVAHLKGLKFDYASSFLKEAKALDKFDQVLVNSLTEMEELKPHLAAEKLVFVPHLLTGIPEADQIPGYGDRPMNYDILFVGAAYGPNIKGVAFFLDAVLPLIVAKRPEVRFAIAGPVCKVVEVPEALKDNVELLGFVPSLVDVYLSSRVVICPLMEGSGTKVKLQEAMAYGVPVVTTAVGASGLAFEDRVNACIEDEAIGFAGAILGLLADEGVAAEMSGRLLETYGAMYAEAVVYGRLDGVLGGVG